MKIDWRMKIYVLRGYAPDPTEQGQAVFSNIYTNEEDALRKLAEIKKDVLDLLEDNFDNGRLEYYSVDHHSVKHNPYTLGSLSAKVTISSGNQKHEDMWRDWSTVALETRSGFFICPEDISLKIDRSAEFSVASITIDIKEM